MLAGLLDHYKRISFLKGALNGSLSEEQAKLFKEKPFGGSMQDKARRRTVPYRFDGCVIKVEVDVVREYLIQKGFLNRDTNTPTSEVRHSTQIISCQKNDSYKHDPLDHLSLTKKKKLAEELQSNREKIDFLLKKEKIELYSALSSFLYGGLFFIFFVIAVNIYPKIIGFSLLMALFAVAVYTSKNLNEIRSLLSETESHIFKTAP